MGWAADLAAASALEHVGAAAEGGSAHLYLAADGGCFFQELLAGWAQTEEVCATRRRRPHAIAVVAAAVRGYPLAQFLFAAQARAEAGADQLGFIVGQVALASIRAETVRGVATSVGTQGRRTFPAAVRRLEEEAAGLGGVRAGRAAAAAWGGVVEAGVSGRSGVVGRVRGLRSLQSAWRALL
eukprot:CAMPEP_0179938284 /NCGR_PEP_ID=MMETSP0983-20121128/14863_1 /TAXON_ID=483367 /ORGANISM="non described non described, Strain CCMP 2436" /LENGTH=182 /DNA_ID=CAMNT_0021844233 /DNA_START=172 /DNA_END=720 /DNA_ORIENTATION=-